MTEDHSLENAGVGFLAGLAVAIAGAIKDAPYEGFNMATFIRSPIIGFFAGLGIGEFYPKIPKPALFLSSIAMERIVVEGYKVQRAVSAGYVPSKFKVGEWGIPIKKLHGESH